MADELQAVLRTALLAAFEAGGYFQSRIQTELVVQTKTSAADVVTDVDRACEQAIRDQIHRCFPDHDILGEEAVEPGRNAAINATQKMLGQKHLWIVDPLDGTTNFVQGIPLSVVSIGYAIDGVLAVGVVFDPYRDEVFFAVRGQGAYLSHETDLRTWIERGEIAAFPGKRISVSGVEDIHYAVVATGLPIRHLDRERVMMRVCALLSQTKSLRTLGAAALHLAYLAAGRIDLFWEYDLNAWDIAAGVLLIEEAGGAVLDMNGQRFCLQTRNLTASSTEQLAGMVGHELQNQSPQ